MHCETVLDEDAQGIGFPLPSQAKIGLRSTTLSTSCWWHSVGSESRPVVWPPESMSSPDATGLDGPSPILKHRSENRVVRELKNVALKGCDEQLRVR